MNRRRGPMAVRKVALDERVTVALERLLPPLRPGTCTWCRTRRQDVVDTLAAWVLGTFLLLWAVFLGAVALFGLRLVFLAAYELLGR